MLAGAFFSDPLLQTIFTLDFPWLYLLPLPFFVYGCMNLARLKGYPGALGLLGASVLPGLILLFLLPDKNAPQAQGSFFSKERIAAFLLIPVFIFWAYQKIDLHLQKNQIEFMVGELDRAALSTAPVYPLNYKLMALRAYLNHGFEFADENELRLREKYWLAHALFEGADRFFIHMQYQQFVRYRSGEDPSAPYNAPDIRRLRNEFSEFFKRKVIELDDDYLIRCCVYWAYMEETYRAEIFSQKTREFIRRLNLIEKDLQSLVSAFVNQRHRMPENAEDLSDFLRAAPRLQKKAAAFKALRSAADVTFEPEGEIILTLRDDTVGLAGQTIVYGLMVRKNFSDVSPLKTHRLLRIGGTLPDKYRVDILWVRFFEEGASENMKKTDFMAHVFEWLIRQLHIFN
ncbi:hypothetical protein DENIS_4217 [Desulfonema ishimotonii]|uniref:Uncharacterized protein n=1 Tax=Desulfonema ishimotonii TaxID=45657 RepID=A0A401G210_9BACT|nr:hypothetical protein DENIS_4217 [Desulfonema ishimotonii]